MIYDITPCPKPRMTRQDKFRGKPGRKPTRPCVARYWAFKQEVQLKMKDIDLNECHVCFYIPMPDSWSKKKKQKMCLVKHQQTPDLDNLFKGLADALYGDDSGIWSISANKVWSYAPAISLSINQ